MVKAIFFDFFGVICQDMGWAWFKRHVKDQKTEKPRLEDIFRRLDLGELSSGEANILMAKMAHATPEDVSAEIDSLVSIDMEVIDFIGSLKKKYKIGLISNCNRTEFNRALNIKNIQGYFDSLIVSSEVGILKPDKKIFNLALQSLEVASGEAIFIDDRESNVNGGKAAGIDSILFTTLHQLRSDLKRRNVSL